MEKYYISNFFKKNISLFSSILSLFLCSYFIRFDFHFDKIFQTYYLIFISIALIIDIYVNKFFPEIKIPKPIKALLILICLRGLIIHIDSITLIVPKIVLFFSLINFIFWNRYYFITLFFTYYLINNLFAYELNYIYNISHLSISYYLLFLLIISKILRNNNVVKSILIILIILYPGTAFYKFYYDGTFINYFEISDLGNLISASFINRSSVLNYSTLMYFKPYLKIFQISSVIVEFSWIMYLFVERKLKLIIIDI